jgi:hypothetical protein
VATRSVAPPAGRREVASNNRSATNDGRLFDTIPQVAQIREYLQQRWKPPADLKQTLQYYLQLNPDGSIERIRPLGEASVRYIDNTGMPAPGNLLFLLLKAIAMPKSVSFLVLMAKWKRFWSLEMYLLCDLEFFCSYFLTNYEFVGTFLRNLGNNKSINK